MRLTNTARETVLTMPNGSRLPRLKGFIDGLQACGKPLSVTSMEDGSGRWTYRVTSGDTETDSAVRAYGVSLGATVGEQELFGWEVGR